MFASPPPLREKIPPISPEVEQVVMTALAKDPHQRFGSVQAFAKALEQANQVSNPEPMPAQPVSPLLTSPQPQKSVEPLSPSPTPYAGDESLQAASFSSSESIPTEVKPITVPSGGKVVPTKSKSEKVKRWKIGKQQIVAMIVGTILYAGLSHSYIHIILTTYYAIMILPALIIPLFLGIVYGPWVGLFTGMAGFVIGEFIPIPDYVGVPYIGIFQRYLFGNYDQIHWYIFLLSSALIGFVAGLSTPITKGRYNTIRSIGIVDAINAIWVFISLNFAYSTIYKVHWPNGIVDLPGFFHTTLPTTIFILIVTPILLVIYNSIANRGKSTKRNWIIMGRKPL